MKTNPLTIFCLLSILLTNLSACADTETETEIKALSVSTSTEEVTTALIDTIEKQDYNEYEFRIVSYIDPNWPQPEFSADEQTGDVLNDAIFKRNSIIEELFNITIVTEEYPDAYNPVLQTVTAGEDAYDLISDSVRNTMNLGLQGCLVDLQNLTNVNFDMPWWAGDYIEQSSVAYHNFFALCSCNIYAYDTTPIVLFNKQMIADYNLENPYDIVNDMRWTMDTMTEMVKNVSGDLDGNGIMDLDDKYGLVGNSFISDVFLYGGDIMFVIKDENDLPQYNPDMERLNTYIEKLLKLTSSEYAYVPDRYPGVDREASPLDAFAENRALFWACPISALFKLRDAEVDYGIIPVPMLDEAQGHYTSYVTSYGTTLAVPITCTDSDRTGNIMEALALASYEIVRPAYYNITLGSKLSQDEESSNMLDTIFSSYQCDIALLLESYGMQAVRDLRDIIISETNTVASITAANFSAYTSMVEKAAEAAAKLD